MSEILAIAEIDIAAPATRVWAALTEPVQIKQYMFGSAVETDGQPGRAITRSGEYNGQRYQDKGQIVAFDPPRRLELTHFSPMSGAEDVPENYHRLACHLTSVEDGIRVRFTQDNNPDEAAAAHVTQNWQNMLAGLKRHIEGG